MQKVINCSCGYIVRAENDEKLVAKAQEHAKQVHQMDLTREQALAMAKPESNAWLRPATSYQLGLSSPAGGTSCRPRSTEQR